MKDFSIEKIFSQKFFLPKLFVVIVIAHFPWLNFAPTGFHKWREADTAGIIWNYLYESWDFFHPKILARGFGDGIVGTEFPIYSYLVALVCKVLGFSHVWHRSVSLCGGLLAIIGCRNIVRHVTHSMVTANLSAFIFGFCPLFFFYSMKIMPDVLGLGLVLVGCDLLMTAVSRFNRQKYGHYVARLMGFVVMAGISAAIKPTFLMVGLPMAVWTIQRCGWRRFFTPSLVMTGLCTVLVPVVWLHYSRDLDAHSAYRGYFYLGEGFHLDFNAIFSMNFLSNVFLTWPWELVVSFQLAWVLLLAVKSLTASTRNFILSWLMALLVIAVMAAGHFSTPHDYYYLPGVLPLVMLTALGLQRAFGMNRPVRVFAVVCLALFPVYSVMRLAGHYGQNINFDQHVKTFQKYLNPTDRAISYDDRPGLLFYYTGTKGFNFNIGSSEEKFREHFDQGVVYVIHFVDQQLPLSPTFSLSSKVVLVEDDIQLSLLYLRPQVAHEF